MNALRSRFRPIPVNFLIWISFPLLLLTVLGSAWRPLGGGDDVWAHAAIGRWILEHRQIPTQTLFLWSEKVPWIAHAWGTGVLFALLMRWGGDVGGPYLIQILNLLFCAAPFALLWRYWRRTASFSSLMPPLFILAIWLGNGRFHPRPELFTALFLTLLYLFLLHWFDDEAPPVRLIPGVLLMFVVWPNLHGAVAVGLAVLWVSALVQLIESRGDLRLLFLAALCTLIVFTCQPRGFDYWRVWLPVSSKMFQRIDEWKPFWKWRALSAQAVGGEAFLWLVGLLLWSKNPHRRWAQLGWMLLMMAAFLQARRQLWLLALTSLTVIVSNAQPLEGNQLFRAWRRLSRGDTSQPVPAPLQLILRIGVLIMLICGLAQSVPPRFWRMGAVNDSLPVGMSAFLLNRAPKGRIFNDYEYSAYLEWAFHGRRTLYIDLNNAYSDDLMDEYFYTLAGSKDLKIRANFDARRGRILAKRKIAVVSLRPFTNKEGQSVLARYLDNNPNWKRIYRAHDGTVWARRDVLKRTSNRAKKPARKPLPNV